MSSKRAEVSTTTTQREPVSSAVAQVQPFKLLSFNIQGGVATHHYRQYVTRAWRYVLPTRERSANLARMAAVMREYDFVAIQEADAGSLRTGRHNLIELLAQAGGFPHHGFAVTRGLGSLAQVCLGFLSRTPVESYRLRALPGAIPGRGLLEVDLQPAVLGPTTIVITHMALGHKSRARQLSALAMHLGSRRAIVVGDFNERNGGLQNNLALRNVGLTPLPHPPATYPSWQPRQSLDQVLVTSGLEVIEARALPVALSDHLPLAIQLVRVP